MMSPPQALFRISSNANTCYIHSFIVIAVISDSMHQGTFPIILAFPIQKAIVYKKTHFICQSAFDYSVNQSSFSRHMAGNSLPQDIHRLLSNEEHI